MNPMIRGKKDIRTPADPQDFESSVSSTALPPNEFTAVSGSGGVTLSVTDRFTAEGRPKAATYRVYFLPGSMDVSTAEKRAAGMAMASYVADIPAPGKGTTLSVTDSVNAGQAGSYFCVAVNERGAESPVEHMVTIS